MSSTFNPLLMSSVVHIRLFFIGELGILNQINEVGGSSCFIGDYRIIVGTLTNQPVEWESKTMDKV